MGEWVGKQVRCLATTKMKSYVLSPDLYPSPPAACEKSIFCLFRSSADRKFRFRTGFSLMLTDSGVQT